MEEKETENPTNLIAPVYVIMGLRKINVGTANADSSQSVLLANRRS
jgi:hypothetical protein